MSPEGGRAGDAGGRRLRAGPRKDRPSGWRGGDGRNGCAFGALATGEIMVSIRYYR